MIHQPHWDGEAVGSYAPADDLSAQARRERLAAMSTLWTLHTATLQLNPPRLTSPHLISSSPPPHLASARLVQGVGEAETPLGRDAWPADGRRRGQPRQQDGEGRAPDGATRGESRVGRVSFRSKLWCASVSRRARRGRWAWSITSSDLCRGRRQAGCGRSRRTTSSTRRRSGREGDGWLCSLVFVPRSSSISLKSWVLSH